MTETLGQRIRAARKGAGFKNAETLAVALGVGVRTVQRWEAGESDPSIRRILEIARLTNQSPQFFFTDEIMEGALA